MAKPATIPPLSELAVKLANPNDAEVNIVERMRTLFYIRYYQTPDAVKALEGGLKHKSVLLRHEIAYVMGQIKQASALPILIKLLDDKKEEEMVRHEAGEAIAALGVTSDEAFAALARHLNDANAPVKETCTLAHKALTNKKEGKVPQQPDAAKQDAIQFFLFNCKKGMKAERKSLETLATLQRSHSSFQSFLLETTGKFTTEDPAQAAAADASKIPELQAKLCDGKATLWDRYEAMFTLRNIGTPAAFDALTAGLNDTTSALFRHEVAFVLGQVQYPKAADALIKVVKNLNEHPMTRHEAALALGACACDASPAGAEAKKKAEQCLNVWKSDPVPVVAESCLVALANIAEA